MKRNSNFSRKIFNFSDSLRVYIITPEDIYNYKLFIFGQRHISASNV